MVSGTSLPQDGQIMASSHPGRDVAKEVAPGLTPPFA
jgi:hypothetical protein